MTPSRLRIVSRSSRTAAPPFDRIKKHGTPPDPVTYALWYAYVSHTPAVVRLEVDKLLATGRALDSYELNEIYDAHLSPKEEDDTNETIGREIENSIKRVSQLLEAGIAENTNFKSTLDDLQETPSTSGGEQDFKTLLSHLISESQKMSEVSSRLTQGLRESQEHVHQLNQELEQAKRQSLLDPLTSVANRRAFEERLNWQVKEAQDTRATFCLVLADLDDFKGVNDNLGHQAGDEVLRVFASTLFEHTKGTDLVARYGGDEFALILPNIEVTAAYNLMVSIKHKFEQMRVTNAQFRGARAQATASFGIAAFKPMRSAEALVAAADTALNRAKTLGRNRVCAEGLS